MADDASAKASPPGDPQRRSQLLAIATRRLMEDGYEKTSISSIVREAGVAQGTFYLYFASKQDLIAVLRRQTLRDYLRAFEAGAAQGAAADERLVRGLLSTAQEVRRKQPLIRVFREASSGAETEAGLVQGRAAFGVPLAAVLRDGVQEGRFDCEDPALAANLILTLVDNLFYEALAYGHPAPDEVTRHALAFVLRALGVPRSRILALVPESR